MIIQDSQTVLDQRVLVLNKHYMALRIVSVKRAFSLLFKNLAEVIFVNQGIYGNYDLKSWQELSDIKRQFEDDHSDWISTVDFDIAVPRIIRLLFYDKLPRQTVKFNRRNIYARDRNLCQYCGRKFPTNELSLDHVIPRSAGGPTSWGNIVCACTKCNTRKGGRNPDQAGMKLINKPVKPRRNPVVHIQLGDRYKSWKQFLDNAYWSVELT